MMEIEEEVAKDTEDLNESLERYFETKPEFKMSCEGIINNLTSEFIIDLDKIFHENLFLYNQILDIPTEIIPYIENVIDNHIFNLSPIQPKYNIIFESKELNGEIEMNNLYKKNLGSLIIMENLIINGISNPIVKYERITYLCPVCQTQMETKQSITEELKQPKLCANPQCKNRKGFIVLEPSSTKTVIQYAWVTQKDRYLKIYIPYYLVNTFKAGDIINLIGFNSAERKNIRTKENIFLNVLRINNMEKIGNDEYQEILTNTSRIYLKPQKGVFIDVISNIEKVTECLLSFDKIDVQNRYMIQDGPIKSARYDGHYITGGMPISFYNADIDMLKDSFQRNCAVSSKHIKQITVPLQKYLNTFPDKTHLVSELIGFSPSGWKLPHNSIIYIQDFTANKVIISLKDIDLKNSDISKLTSEFKEFYDKTGIFHKDIILSWVMVSPFLYVYRKLRNIMPLLALQGTGNTGKTSYLETLVNKCFGHINLFTAQSIKSASRLESILSSSTLPVFIDDVTNANLSFVDTIKSYLTGDARKQRMGAGVGRQFLTIDKPLCAPTCLTCNDPPEWFSDNYFLERVLLDVINNMDVKKGWYAARDNLKTGCLLALLYDHTKNWDIEKFKQELNCLKLPEELNYEESRIVNIYTIFALGAKLTKDILNIDINLTPVLKILKKTRKLNLDTMGALMSYQIDHGKPKWYENDTLGIAEYKPPRDSWVKTPLMSANYINDNDPENPELVECWAWTVTNIRELQAEFEGMSTKRWTLQTFFVKNQKSFPDLRSGRYKVEELIDGEIKRKLRRAVLIPKDHFIMDSEDK